MKKFKFISFVALALCASMTFVSCDDDDDDDPVAGTPTTPTPTEKTIAEIAVESGETDSLVVALSRAGLVTTFQNAGTYTVFAPNNEAFRNFLSTNGYAQIADIPVDALTEVLTYHVLGTEVMSKMLDDDTYGVTLNTASPDMDATVVEVDVTGGVKLNNTANVVMPDINASNGVIHLISEVITPRNVVELALNDERFTSLVAALTAYDFGYTTTLSGTGPFTVFAPTNDAFDKLIDGNPAWNSLADIDSTTLAAVLTYHVVNGLNVQSTELSQDQSVPTLNGANLTVDLSMGAQLKTASVAQTDAVNIIVTNVQGTNGVIHAVDKVLLP